MISIPHAFTIHGEEPEHAYQNMDWIVYWRFADGSCATTTCRDVGQAEALANCVINRGGTEVLGEVWVRTTVMREWPMARPTKPYREIQLPEGDVQ